MTATIPTAAVRPLEDRGVLDAYYGRDDLTAPIVVNTLGDKAALLDRFTGALGPDWRIVTVPELGDTWVARWDRTTLAVGDRTEVRYVDRIRTHRAIARKALRLVVVRVVDDLGLTPRRMFLHPATPRKAHR